MSRNKRQRALGAMPLRPYHVHNPEPFYEEEQEWRLIAARCPSQAARIWRERGGHRPCDYPAEDLHIEPAVWQWPETPEPRTLPGPLDGQRLRTAGRCAPGERTDAREGA